MALWIKYTKYMCFVVLILKIYCLFCLIKSFQLFCLIKSMHLLYPNLLIYPYLFLIFWWQTKRQKFIGAGRESRMKRTTHFMFRCYCQIKVTYSKWKRIGTFIFRSHFSQEYKQFQIGKQDLVQDAASPLLVFYGTQQQVCLFKLIRNWQWSYVCYHHILLL